MATTLEEFPDYRMGPGRLLEEFPARALKTHCAHGHEYTPENIWLDQGRRKCRTCHKEVMRRGRLRKKDPGVDSPDGSV